MNGVSFCSLYIFQLLVLVLFSSNIECLIRKDITGERLKILRNEMVKHGYSVYIIPSEDEHQSEYVASYDERRQWISGFTGSAGTAVVTLTKAALWTDARYFLAANEELDTNWILQKEDFPGYPSLEDWIVEEMEQFKNKTIGLNAKFTSISEWKALEEYFNMSALNLVSPDIDLIDLVWTTGRPPLPNSKIYIHEMKYAGKSWQDKVNEVVDRIKAAKADVYVVTALDEVAWLFNLRAADIPYNPMFFSYAIIDKSGSHKLYILDISRVDNALKDHLKGISTLEYNQVFADIEKYSKDGKIVWISPMSSYRIYNAVFNKTLLVNDKASPVKSLKAVKNEVEIKNARKCQIRDSAYRIRHMLWLEEEMKKGAYITELSSAYELERIQGEDKLFRGLSFDSISAVGAHASVIHYAPANNTDWQLTTSQIYLLDAGAQFEDCTTDITRTHHYGKPSYEEIQAYTRVLQGSIDLADLVFPPNLKGRDIDVVTRASLWRYGIDYAHGTGHGIGYYLNVHEDPPYTNYKYNDPYDEPFVPGMFQSDEPGYYEDNVFGIRLETDIEVVEANTPYHFRNITYFKFEAQTLVPFERNLIDVKLLTGPQIKWLNDYNKKIRDEVGPYLKELGQNDVYEYMLRKTEPISLEAVTQLNSSIKRSLDTILYLSFLLITSVTKMIVL